jgi:AhpD family alkylhydroperoxidase
MNMDDRTKKLLAVSASVGANCHPCLEYHVGKALELGIERNEITEAVEIAKIVRKGATTSMDALALKLLSNDLAAQSCNKKETACCCS